MVQFLRADAPQSFGYLIIAVFVLRNKLVAFLSCHKFLTSFYAILAARKFQTRHGEEFALFAVERKRHTSCRDPNILSVKAHKIWRCGASPFFQPFQLGQNGFDFAG